MLLEAGGTTQYSLGGSQAVAGRWTIFDVPLGWVQVLSDHRWSKQFQWDVPADPFHARGASAQFRPVELDTGDRFELAEDLVVRERQSVNQGVEGSWGDRMSFLRAHNRVRDVYRQEVVAAKAACIRLRARSRRGGGGRAGVGSKCPPLYEIES